MSHNRRMIGTLAALALAALLAGCILSPTPGASVSGPTLPTRELTGEAPEILGPDDTLRRDAQEYAEQFQDGIGELNAVLQANESDTFGGLWIEHEPDYRVVVLFTRQGERTIRPYLAGRPYAHLVEVRQARYTLAELETIQAQAARELAKLDFNVSSAIDVQNNRVKVWVSDRAWFEAELGRAGAHLPAGVELTVVEGGATARDKDLLLTPPVPGADALYPIAFPRQKPVEGFRVAMAAALAGTLRLEEGCLRVYPLHDSTSLLPIWPPEFTLRADGAEVLVIDGEGQVVARAGEEVYMGGGSVPVTDEWVLQQIPLACRGEYFIVGTGVRPNLNFHSDLFALDVLSDTVRTVLFLRYRPALDKQVTDVVSMPGKLVAYDLSRCLHVQTEWGPGSVTLLWPSNWSVRLDEETFVVVDGTGQAVARMGDEVRLRGRAIPHSTDGAVYRQLIDELPGDCVGASWLVDGVE